MDEEKKVKEAITPPDENTVFILGILSLVFTFTMTLVGLILAIIGMVKGNQLMKWTEEKGLPKPELGYTGYVCSKIALYVSLGLFALVFIVVILALVIFLVASPKGVIIGEMEDVVSSTISILNPFIY
jgi:hypothetical protein